MTPPGTRDDLSLIRSFDLKRLAALREVARLGSFAAAASALSLTPSAVSQQMAALEKDTGTRLFRRTPRGMRPTDAGLALVGHSDAVFARLTEADADLKDIARGRAGSLRLGSFTSATSVFVGTLIETLQRREPRLDLRFMDGEPYESLVRLRERRIDLALVFRFARWPIGMDYDRNLFCEESGFTFVDLFDDPLQLVLPDDHRAAASDLVTFKQIARDTILATDPWVDDLRDASARAGTELLIDEQRFRGTGFEALQTFVHAGRGLTLMPQLAAGWLRGGLVMRQLQGAPSRRVQLASLEGTTFSPSMSAFIDLLSDVPGIDWSDER